MLARAETHERLSRSVFSRIVVGVDGTEAGYEAARQARRLAEPHADIDVVAAKYLAGATLAGWSATRLDEEIARETAASLQEALRIVGPAAVPLSVNGAPSEALLEQIRELKTSVVAVGTHGHSRASEILIGGTTGTLLHAAPCSVLVARPPGVQAPFPNAIVVGSDGSDDAALALAVARRLSDRLDAPLRVVTALHDNPYLARVPHEAELVEATAVDALTSVSEAVDLVVVGSRGLLGMHALGSVSERVAHTAASSVLVVRERKGG
jgi:nucleotide-binding universal stress UspA family protein